MNMIKFLGNIYGFHDGYDGSVFSEEGISPAILAAQTHIPHVIRQRESTEQPVRLGNVYDERFGQSYGGNVWDTSGLAPTLKSSGSRGQECIVVESDEDRVKDGRADG